MKILLTAVNAKYIHSNLAIYSLRAYAKQYENHVEIAEFTINNYVDDILMGIYEKKPDVVAFSCYIWNINMILETAMELRKVMPNVKIWLGGPEVTYEAHNILKKYEFIDGIMIGEGERTFLHLCEYYVKGIRALHEIHGISYRMSAKLEVGSPMSIGSMDIVEAIPQEPMDMDEIPFVYESMEDFKNKIVYYETSRGCPYSCSYCLSSIDKKVRFRNTELVKKELKFFIDHEVPQVKFVDRTFNCNRKHTMEIVKFIKEYDKGITNFHFEVSADILNDEEIELFNSLRPGLVQLEIGVQSTNELTVSEIRRKMDFNKLSEIVKRIYAPRNIHQHLDLIVGLPYEDYESFKKSFNDVYGLKPDQLQVGFLKVLSGSYMVEQSAVHGVVYKSYAPYEVLFTKYLSYDEVLHLKKVTDMVEVYYNSMQFTNSIEYMEHFFETPFTLYDSLAKFYVAKGIYGLSQSRLNRYYLLLEFFGQIPNVSNEQLSAFSEILLYDLYLREKLKSRPSFAKNTMLSKSLIHGLLSENRNVVEQVKIYHIESFTIDIKKTVESGAVVEANDYVFFDYDHRDPLSHDATVTVLNSPTSDFYENGNCETFNL